MSKDANSYGRGKMLLLLIFSGWLLYGLACAAFFVVISALSKFSPLFMEGGLAAVCLFIAAGVFFMALAAISYLAGREAFPFIKTRNVWMKYFVPVARSVSKRIGLDPDKVVRSYINVSNEFIINGKKEKPVANIMILLPHCLQLHSCGMKLTSNVRNCRKCGRCVVHSFIELSDELGVDIFVASGGTMARQQIAAKKPDMILAVACERDLLSGIRDSLPMPVLGVLNERPQGPCVNTTVDTSRITKLIGRIKTA